MAGGLGECQHRDQFPDEVLARGTRGLLITIPHLGAEDFDVLLPALEVTLGPLRIPEQLRSSRVLCVAPGSASRDIRRQGPADVWSIREIAIRIPFVEPSEHVEPTKIDLASRSREVLLDRQGYRNLHLANEVLEAGEVLPVELQVLGIVEGRR
jgi:hypothetical protein